MSQFIKLDQFMSNLKGIKALKARYDYDRMSNWGVFQKKDYDTQGEDKINVRGKQLTGYADPFTRLREDKLRSMKRALYNSYQAAVIKFDKDDRQFHFRCLINHDKLKVDYQDKILSIPFREVPVEYEHDNSISDKFVDTGTPGEFYDSEGNLVEDENGNTRVYRVRPGDTFQWISGNDGYMPNSYWIIYLQYSQETAYFRGQIRKADDQIEVIPIEEDGSEGEPIIYHGWTVGPNEQEAIWNVKKGVVWNDLYYTKLLYITKDETTTQFFNRFERVVINGQTWEVNGYNDNYGTTSKNSTGGLIRVALKETYTSTNEQIEKMKQMDQQLEYEIIGPERVQTYDVVKYYVPNGTGSWSVSAAAPVEILSQSQGEIKLKILKVKTKTTFSLNYENEELIVTVEPFG